MNEEFKMQNSKFKKCIRFAFRTHHFELFRIFTAPDS